MMQSELVAPVIEPVEGRYDRDWLNLNDDRKVRGFDYMDSERQDREYVDPDLVNVTTVTNDVEIDGKTYSDTVTTVTGTVTATGDNNPAGFNQAAFEADLEYNPNA